MARSTLIVFLLLRHLYFSLLLLFLLFFLSNCFWVSLLPVSSGPLMASFSFIFVRSRQCFVSNDPFPASFSLFSSSQHSFNTVEVYTICWWLDSNHGSLVLVVTALTSVPQTPRFERSHRQSIILFICLLSTVRKRQKWIKRCRDGPFKKIDFQFELW